MSGVKVDLLAVLREARDLRALTQGKIYSEYDGSLARIDNAIVAATELIEVLRQATAYVEAISQGNARHVDPLAAESLAERANAALADAGCTNEPG